MQKEETTEDSNTQPTPEPVEVKDGFYPTASTLGGEVQGVTVVPS